MIVSILFCSTFPPNGKRHPSPYTNQGVATFDPGCANLRIYWSDSSVWCKGDKLGGDDCGNHGPTPPPTPAPTNFHIELHMIEHTHDDVGWIKTIPDCAQSPLFPGPTDTCGCVSSCVRTLRVFTMNLSSCLCDIRRLHVGGAKHHHDRDGRARAEPDPAVHVRRGRLLPAMVARAKRHLASRSEATGARRPTRGAWRGCVSHCDTQRLFAITAASKLIMPRDFAVHKCRVVHE